MDVRKQNVVLAFLFGVLLVTLVGLFFSLSVSKTGRAGDMRTSPSKVLIKGHIALSMSGNLSDGIDFGEVENLPDFINATANYNSTSQTGYDILVDKSSNKAADFCMNASLLDTDAGDYIGRGNYTFSNSTTNDINDPSLLNRMPLPAAPIKVAEGISRDTSINFRFWLNISGGQEAGLYNNSVSFIGVPTMETCT